MAKFKNKRVGLTRYVVPHESSSWYMRRVIYIAIGAGSALGLGMWIYHEQLVGALGLYRAADTSQLLTNYRYFMLLFSITIAALTTLVYFALFGVFIFHRVAGPVYHMKRHMEEICRGETEIKPLKLRNGDQMQDVADVYNQLLVKMKLLASGEEQKEEEGIPEGGERARSLG